jgi:hypothetical protein
MASTTRKLVFHKSVQFTGWSCTACGWAKPIPRLVEPEGITPKDIETDFANHDCAKYPRPRKREDFSQAAARIVTEATEQK